MTRPEPELREAAEDMLRIIFDENATDDDVDAAATTLVDIVAPQILKDSLPKWMFCEIPDPDEGEK